MFQPYLMKNPTSIIPFHPIQRELYSTYHLEAMFFYELQGWIFNNVFDFGNKNDQNTFIVHLQYSDEILVIAERDCQSPNAADTNKYTAGCFFSTITALVTDIERRCCRSTTPICSSTFPPSV